MTLKNRDFGKHEQQQLWEISSSKLQGNVAEKYFELAKFMGFNIFRALVRLYDSSRSTEYKSMPGSGTLTVHRSSATEERKSRPN
jgi:hypothetical protein